MCSPAGSPHEILVDEVLRLGSSVHRLNLQRMLRYCYVYVLRSLIDYQFYVGLTRDLPAQVNLHNRGRVSSTKKRAPFELVYWEGCLNESDAAQREKYLKSAWGKRYIKTRLRRYLTGSKKSILGICTSQCATAKAARIVSRCCQ
jgi:putative endonuclease